MLRSLKELLSQAALRLSNHPHPLPTTKHSNAPRSWFYPLQYPVKAHGHLVVSLVRSSFLIQAPKWLSGDDMVDCKTPFSLLWTRAKARTSHEIWRGSGSFGDDRYIDITDTNPLTRHEMENLAWSDLLRNLKRVILSAIPITASDNVWLIELGNLSLSGLSLHRVLHFIVHISISCSLWERIGNVKFRGRPFSPRIWFPQFTSKEGLVRCAMSMLPPWLFFGFGYWILG